MKTKTAKSLSEKVGQASSLTVHGASVPRLPDGRMPPEPADRMSAPPSPGGSQRAAKERGVHAASTSAQQDASSLTNARVGRKLKRAEARAPLARLWQLRLYVMDQTPKSLTAFSNLKKFCETHLEGRYRITVIDLLKQPHLAKGDQILAIPTVVRMLPKPVRTLIGTFSDTARVLVGLDLRAAD